MISYSYFANTEIHAFPYLKEKDNNNKITINFIVYHLVIL